VREDTAELATYQLTDENERRGSALLARQLHRGRREASPSTHSDMDEEPEPEPEPVWTPEPRTEFGETSGASTPSVDVESFTPAESPSLLARALKRYRSPGQTSEGSGSDRQTLRLPSPVKRTPLFKPLPEDEAGEPEEARETTPLLRVTSQDSSTAGGSNGHYDLESQKAPKPKLLGFIPVPADGPGARISHFLEVARSPKRWDGRAVWQTAVVGPFQYIPAVTVGLLLNILDALSYGKGLFGVFFMQVASSSLPRSRHDPLPSRQPHLCQSRVGWHIYLLRQHHHLADRLLHREHLQGWDWFGVGMLLSQQTCTSRDSH
jgi:sulfate permease, SulP family